MSEFKRVVYIVAALAFIVSAVLAYSLVKISGA